MESAEKFRISLRKATGGAVLGSPKTATDTITDGDFAFRFDPISYVVREGVSFAVIQVKRLGYLGSIASVDLVSQDDTAKAGQDYTAVNNTLTFDEGQNLKTFEVQILNDVLIEKREKVILNLLNPSGGGTLGTYKTASLYIDDNDSGVTP